MSYSFTATETKTFTLTHAKHLAAKVTADLKRLQRLYGDVSDERIAQFEGEATELLRQGYLRTVTYGFKRDGSWIEPTLRYTASDLANGGTDDDPGRVRPGINISGASFHSYLTYSSAWWALTPDQRAAIDQAARGEARRHIFRDQRVAHRDAGQHTLGGDQLAVDVQIDRPR